jgi:hypothetical protein
MKRKYKVKLPADAIVKFGLTEGDTIVNGYLAFCGEVQIYDLKDANKKAYNWEGTKECYTSDILTDLTDGTIQRISYNVLTSGVLKALAGREAFKDADPSLGELIYHGDVFEAILSENAQLKESGSILAIGDEKTLQQLDDLSRFVSADYLHVVKV